MRSLLISLAIAVTPAFALAQAEAPAKPAKPSPGM